MVTKKAATKVTTKSAILKFSPDWIKDPPPPFSKTSTVLPSRELAQAKKDFTARVKEILARGGK